MCLDLRLSQRYLHDVSMRARGDGAGGGGGGAHHIQQERDHRLVHKHSPHSSGVERCPVWCASPAPPRPAMPHGQLRLPRLPPEACKQDACLCARARAGARVGERVSLPNGETRHKDDRILTTFRAGPSLDCRAEEQRELGVGLGRGGAGLQGCARAALSVIPYTGEPRQLLRLVHYHGMTDHWAH